VLFFTEYHFGAFSSYTNPYTTGNTVTINTIVISVPKKMIAAIPDHIGLALIIIGSTPIEAQAEVRKIGHILRFPASNLR